MRWSIVKRYISQKSIKLLILFRLWNTMEAMQQCLRWRYEPFYTGFVKKKFLEGGGGIGEQVDPIRNIRKIYPTGSSFWASPSTFYVKHQNSINALAAFTSKDEVASTATAAFTSNRKKLMPNNKMVLSLYFNIYSLGDG